MFLVSDEYLMEQNENSAGLVGILTLKTWILMYSYRPSHLASMGARQENIA